MEASTPLLRGPLLVTGAAGQLGQRVLHHLLDTLQAPAHQLIATTREPARLAAWAARGVAVRAADFDRPEGLAAAFAGAHRLLLISTDTLAGPGQRLQQHVAAVRAAEAAGVDHVVYTSMPQPDRSAVLFAPDHAGTEAALAASRLPGWTVLRHHWYFENLLASLPPALASGRWVSAAGDGRIAHIARDDLALAAATALASGRTGRTTLTLGGARAHSTAEIAALVSQATGRPLQVVPVAVDALVQGMVAAGLPEPVAQVYASIDVNTAQGGLAEVTGDFAALVGRPPRAFEDWLAEHAAEFAGAPAQAS
ncbi:NmrA family NAD(P)-binding protein [Ideonella sp.]|uniref:NmrA family NAD(P)-binding protein n=1 Tax=Ideonella sp. TaxID=1929293 RepID=UPI0035B1FDC3